MAKMTWQIRVKFPSFVENCLHTYFDITCPLFLSIIFIMSELVKPQRILLGKCLLAARLLDFVEKSHPPLSIQEYLLIGRYGGGHRS